MRSGSFVVCMLSVVIANAVSSGQATVPDAAESAPEMTVIVQPDSVEITGVVSSIANENILRESAARLFPARPATADLHIGSSLPPGWSLVTDLTLRALAETRSATAAISPFEISVRGFSEDSGRWETAADRLQSYLPEGWTIRYQVEALAAGASMNRQCVELFRTAMRGRGIEFERASAAIGTASMPLLDELIQIAADCPDSAIEITGHTDATGGEAANLALSQQRANAVAGYLAAGGIAAQRIRAAGVGSKEPLVTEGTPQARRLNRRIEIELAFR